MKLLGGDEKNNKGKKALTLKTAAESDHKAKNGLVANNSGFSLHAGVAMAGSDREKIEKLCRYIARPAVALEQLHLNANGQVRGGSYHYKSF